jgi:hypothetical protein
MSLSDFVGLVGTLSVLSAYFFLQSGYLRQERPMYSALNGFGACCIMFSLLYNFNLASFILQVCWLLVSLLGLYRALRDVSTRK